MSEFKQISMRGNLLEAPLCPCPWCKKTPNLLLPLDQKSDKETWMWKIYCDCKVYSGAHVSIRKTSKTNLGRFLDKVDMLFDKWNGNNPIKAYEKKVLDLKMISNLGVK